MTCRLGSQVVQNSFKLEVSLPISDPEIGAGVTHAVLHRENELLAVSTDDMALLVYDSARRCLVRR